MRKQFAVFLILLVVTTALNAQWLELTTPGIPRTADGNVDLNAATPITANGRPDLSGLWRVADERGTLFDTSKIQGWALDFMARQKSNFFSEAPRYRCLPAGPASFAGRIVQHTDFIAVLNDDLTYRQIFIDGRDLDDNPVLPTWLGYSVAHWEGDTLVVESNGFNDKTWLTPEGLPHTDQLRITERYHRPDFGHINLEVIYEDPGTFTEPVQAVFDLVFRADSPTLEVVCNESETAQSHYNGEISQSEQKIVTVSEETLAKYVGTFQGVWLGRQITAVVTFEDGDLYLTRTPRYSAARGESNSEKSKLIAQSETAFDSSFGLGWVFIVNGVGEVNELIEVHVSGDYPFRRVQ